MGAGMHRQVTRKMQGVALRASHKIGQRGHGVWQRRCPLVSVTACRNSKLDHAHYMQISGN
jgi:hypothetical protein